MTPGTFTLVSRGIQLLDGWGFPEAARRNFAHPSTYPGAVLLRSILFPSTESDMLAQLVRWHYAVIRSRPHIWRSLANPKESYEPCGVFKDAIDSDLFKACADPLNGYLYVGYHHKGETSGLSGSLVRTGDTSALLTFPGWVGEVAMYQSENPDVWRVDWPTWLDTYAAFIIPEADVTPTLKLTFRLRAVSFDAVGMVSRISETCSNILHEAGLLAGFFSAVKPLDKLAVAWLALAIIEEKIDQQTREGELVPLVSRLIYSPSPGGSSTPANTLLFKGQPLQFKGEYLTSNQLS